MKNWRRGQIIRNYIKKYLWNLTKMSDLIWHKIDLQIFFRFDLFWGDLKLTQNCPLSQNHWNWRNARFSSILKLTLCGSGKEQCLKQISSVSVSKKPWSFLHNTLDSWQYFLEIVLHLKIFLKKSYYVWSSWLFTLSKQKKTSIDQENPRKNFFSQIKFIVKN